MERKYVSADREKISAQRQRAEKKGGLTAALWAYSGDYIGSRNFYRVWDELTKIYGKAPNCLKTAKEFWHPELKKALVYLVDEKFLKVMMEEAVPMIMEGQFSSSMWRRSYRSKEFGYYACKVITEITGCIYQNFYNESVEELLYCQHEWMRGFEIRLALEIRRGNGRIISLIREAILGDNQTVFLTGKIIRAIIISGDKELTELLLKLLVAARLQEGLRQQILENADAGSIETFTKILKVCLDEDLFRYSSATRAFDVWTGLGYGDAKPSAVRKCAEFAYECITDEAVCRKYADSENNLEAYFALWGMACRETARTDEMARRLLEDKRKYRRALGWMFVTHTDNAKYRMHMAEKYLEERDEEILAWVICNLDTTSQLIRAYTYGKTEWKTEAVENSNFPDSARGRRELFDKLKSAAEFIGNKNRTFTGNPFAFSSVTLNNDPVLSCMMSAAGYDMDQKMVEELAEFIPFMSVDLRRSFYNNFLEIEKNGEHRRILREALNDRSVPVRELAAKRLSMCSLLNEDLEALADSLRSKSSSLRKAVLSIFQKQKPERLSPLITKMLSSREEYQIQGGIELLLAFKEDHPKLLKEQEEPLGLLKATSLSTQTAILLRQLDAAGSEEAFGEDWTPENGFGLYDPAKAAEMEKAEKQEFLSEKELKALIPPFSELENMLERMNAVFEKHADYEYETEIYDGSRKKVLFGDAGYGNILYPADVVSFQGSRRDPRLVWVPFYEEFVEALGDYAKDTKKLAGLCYVCARYQWGISSYLEENQSWFEKYLEKGLCVSFHSVNHEKYGRRYWQIMDIIGLLPQQADTHELFSLVLKIYQGMIHILGEENLNRNYAQQKKRPGVWSPEREHYPINHRMIGYWRVLLKQTANSEEDFKEWFLLEHRLERTMKVGVMNSLGMNDYFRACQAGLIPVDALYEWLLLGHDGPAYLRSLTTPVRSRNAGKLLDTYPWAKEFVQKTVCRIVEVEGKRGELPTPLTGAARAIERFEGAEYFCNLLAALGKENFFRGYEYSSDTTKRAVLSRLLKRCYPAKEDTPEKLKEYIKKTDIKDKRLVEAVMYAPQWAAFAEEILDWPGLKCGVWFFHAHVNETFSAEKETEVALYSPISPAQFNDGAFDKNWFQEAYGKLGEKRFQILYKSAKYITSGSNQHRRSQLYTDAALGKLDAEALKAEITEKRNQEKLRCYPLIPIEEGHSEEALRRYEFIQKFLKESKQFGSQRRESEKKACATAMENLAITTGFMDVNRMTWYLEREKMEEIRPLMQPAELGGVMVWLTIDEEGDAALATEKNGKPQKTLPKAFNKNETVLTLKATVKELKEQKRRARESLERAMVESVEFGADELGKIIENPVLSPMLRRLVWTKDGQNGFLKGEGKGLCLCGAHGEEVTLKSADRLRVAHPYDLLQAGEWADYMHLLYEQQLKQPFKQVFREYYPITEDERQEKTISRRYAGHQVQPKKTVALLKGRGWTVDYEEGLQKVFYKENLIVRMYALADWFSPADIEAPTLETIQFYDRNTGKAADLEKIPPILFSEAMRDMDLVVSVAHVGGVDPEASHSTVEMRTAIAAELVKLLKLGNVEFIGSHAKVRGTLSNYSVHMGSGVVHAEGRGMLAILPVHSQAKGRIFLPFADEDPKTAEIMSKIILLSEDKKIKDPAILSQIRG